MALRVEYALHHSGLEAFLFAPLWQESNGSMLSVLSALARLDMDPWKEAAVLASKSRRDAATALAAILARLPKSSPEPPNYSTLAERAVAFLPDAAAERAVAAEVAGGGSVFAKHATLIVALSALAAILLTRAWPF